MSSNVNNLKIFIMQERQKIVVDNDVTDDATYKLNIYVYSFFSQVCILCDVEFQARK